MSFTISIYYPAKIYHTLFVLFILLSAGTRIHAELISLDEVSVTAARTEKDIQNTPYTLYSLSSDMLQNRMMVRTIPEAMKEIPGIMIQKTAHGQGSPFIRGFTGFRTLFMIDGIRLNNSILRDGPNQYWNTVDFFSVDTLDIIKGPISVLYGSDAIGGSVNVLTIKPDYSDKTEYNGSARTYLRWSDAEDSTMTRCELGGAYHKKWGFVFGFSYKNFGNLDGGQHVGEQEKTGYDENDWDLKAEYMFSQDSSLTFVHQQVEQDDIWRTHKTVYGINWRGTEIGKEYARIFDQDRKFTYLRYIGRNIGSIVDKLQLTFSYQTQKEKRYRLRNKNDELRSDMQGVDVDTTGVSAQIDTIIDSGILTCGVEYYHDNVDSFRKNYNGDLKHGGHLLDNGIEIQGPVGDDAYYDLLGIYFQYDFSLFEFLDLIIGSRYNYIKADANKVLNPETDNKISIDEVWNSFAGSIRALYRLDKYNHYNMFGGISQGFRAPNLSDLTRFDSARSNEIETPATDLDPENYITYEIGLKIRFNKFQSQLSYFYTDIDDMIIRTPTGINLGDYSDPEYEVTKKNSGEGYVTGVEIGLSWRFNPQITLFGDFSWIDGEIDTYPSSSSEKKAEPLSRLMPATCHAGIRWKPIEQLWIESVVTIAKEQDNLSSRDKADTQRIPPGGTPGYTVYCIRGGCNIHEFVTITAAIENVFDKNYRINGSGLNEPGRNFVISLEAKF